MASELKPKTGFDWSKVTWGRPDSRRSALCSYCSAVITEDDVPLILSSAGGFTAQFCDKCKETWWDLMRFDDLAPDHLTRPPGIAGKRSLM